MHSDGLFMDSGLSGSDEISSQSLAVLVRLHIFPPFVLHSCQGRGGGQGLLEKAVCVLISSTDE